MRVLILSQWYPPEPEFKVSALAKGLAARDHQVLVITGFPNYPIGRLYPSYKIRPWQWEQELAQRSRTRAEYFSWERAALQIRRVFEDVYTSGRMAGNKS